MSSSWSVVFMVLQYYCQRNLPSNQCSYCLSNTPERRLHCQKKLMGGWYKFKENSTINGLIASSTQANEGAEDTDGDKVGAAGADKSSNCRQEQRNIESNSTTNEICSHGPYTGTYNETSVFRHCEEGNTLDLELCLDGWTDDGDGLHPELISISVR